jgi:hypothetical protein
VRINAWRAAFSSTPSRPSTSMNADVHAVSPAGSTNSPSTVNSSPRALADPAACRRDRVGAVADIAPILAEEENATNY